MIRPVVIAPHSALKAVARPVENITSQVRQILDDMVETMYADKGCGLAANQINLLARLIVMDCSEKQNTPMQFINPEITWKSEETEVHKEGCLSFPKTYVEVSRSKIVRLRYLDPQGQQHEEEMDGIWAICAQHEVDHLNGITFVDHLPKAQQRQILEKIQRGKKS